MSKISHILATCLLAAGVSQVAPASGATLSILATVDQTIQEVDGAPSGLGPADDGFLRVFGIGETWRAALEFNLGAFPGTPTSLTSATLRLVDGGTKVDELMQVHGYAGDGIITPLEDGTIDNQVAFYFVDENSATPDTHLLDVTEFVRSLLLGSADYAGFMVRAGTEGRFSGADICSSESAGSPPCGPDFVPLLTLVFDDGNGNGGGGTVPEPGSLALIAAGALALAARLRKPG